MTVRNNNNNNNNLRSLLFSKCPYTLIKNKIIVQTHALEHRFRGIKISLNIINLIEKIKENCGR